MEKKKIIILVIALVAALIITGVVSTIKNNSTLRKSQRGDRSYRYVEGYPDMSFAIPVGLAGKASAISRISETMDINKENIYLYRDEDDYLLFGINKILIAAQRNTDFSVFDKEDKESAIRDSSVANIWFDKDASRKFNYTQEKDFFVGDVSAGLVVTNEMYNDYVGQLAVMNEGGVEYSIFAGVPADSSVRFVKLDKDTQKIIGNIVGSLTTEAPAPMVIEEVYAVSISSDTIAKVSSLDGKENEDNKSKISENAVSVSAGNLKDTVSDNMSDTVIISDGNKTSSEEFEETIVFEEEPVEYETPEENEKSEETPSDESGRKKLKLDNQKMVKKEEGKAYTSNIYAMLKLKDNGLIKEYDPSTKEVVTPVITMNKVYKGETAMDMIRRYYENDKTLNYFSPPVGCEWHIAEYKLSYAGCKSKPYINIKLKGIDGNELNYLGVSYGKRTYDMNENGIYRCFYAVPIGCREYALECGTGSAETHNNENSAAYYHISY